MLLLRRIYKKHYSKILTSYRLEQESKTSYPKKADVYYYFN